MLKTGIPTELLFRKTLIPVLATKKKRGKFDKEMLRNEDQMDRLYTNRLLYARAN